jgi:uncharacterized tellurite resistance protein B-like protein
MSGPTPEYRAFVEAGMGICMSVIMADGKITRDETAWWNTRRLTHPLFRDVPEADFNAMLNRVQAQLREAPWKALVDSWAQAVPQRFRGAILELAAELAVTDKDLAGKEPEVVKHLWRALGIAEDEGRKVFIAKIEAMGG